MDESVIDQDVYAELQDTAGVEFVAELVDTFLQRSAGHAGRAAQRTR